MTEIGRAYVTCWLSNPYEMSFWYTLYYMKKKDEASEKVKHYVSYIDWVPRTKMFKSNMRW